MLSNILLAFSSKVLFLQHCPSCYRWNCGQLHQLLCKPCHLQTLPWKGLVIIQFLTCQHDMPWCAFLSFSGISIVNFFAPDFICEFDMRLYPFDTQICRVNIIVKGTDRNLVNMRNGSLHYLGGDIVSQYIIKDVYIAENLVNIKTLSKQQCHDMSFCNFSLMQIPWLPHPQVCPSCLSLAEDFWALCWHPLYPL